MDTVFEQRVRERAYAIWMASGMDCSSADAHWLSAEEAIRNEAEQVTAPLAKAAIAKPRVVKTAAPRKSAKKAAMA